MIRYKNNRINLACNHRGFTLVELMVALAMSTILIMAVYAAYTIQQKSHYTQSQVVEIQQNIRAAMEMFSQDVRMATYDPGGNAGANIPVANRSTLQVRMDLNDDGDFADANEDITYALSDDDGTGVSTSGWGNLTRNDNNNTAPAAPVAENIHAIEFYYRAVDDAFPPATTPASLNNIQSVQLSILSATELRDAKYTNSQTYTPASGIAWANQPFNDNFRRRLLTQTISIRNQGL